MKETARIKLVVTSVPGADSFLVFGLASLADRVLGAYARPAGGARPATAGRAAVGRAG